MQSHLPSQPPPCSPQVPTSSVLAPRNPLKSTWPKASLCFTESLLRAAHLGAEGTLGPAVRPLLVALLP